MHSSDEHTRNALATILDGAVIVLVAVTVVLLFGGSPWIRIGGYSILLPQRWRLILFAVLLSIVRFGIARGSPILPLLNNRDMRRVLDRERERFATPAGASRTVKWYALAAATASLVWVSPHLRDIRRVPTVGDPVFSAWRLARFTHQLVNEPTQLFERVPDGRKRAPEILGRKRGLIHRRACRLG